MHIGIARIVSAVVLCAILVACSAERSTTIPATAVSSNGMPHIASHVIAPDFTAPRDDGYRIVSSGHTFFYPGSVHLVIRGSFLEVKGKGFVSLHKIGDVGEVSKRETPSSGWRSLAATHQAVVQLITRTSCVDPSDTSCLVSCDPSGPLCSPCPDCWVLSPWGPIPNTGSPIICFLGPCSDDPAYPFGRALYRFPDLSCTLDLGTDNIDCYSGENNTGAFDSNLLYAFIFNVLLARDEAYSYTPTHTGIDPPFRAVVHYQPNVPGWHSSVFIDNFIRTDEVAYYGIPGSPAGRMDIIFSTMYPKPRRNGYAGYGFGANPSIVLGG